MTDLGITKSNKYLRNAHLIRKKRGIEVASHVYCLAIEAVMFTECFDPGDLLT